MRPITGALPKTDISMPFTEEIKLAIKRRAHFSCCLCEAIGIKIHHIIPQADGGADTEENGAPLCPSCHEIYRANPTNRKLIEESRNFWYEICENRYKSDPNLLASLDAQIKNVATKADLDAGAATMKIMIEKIANDGSRSIPQRQASLSQAAGIFGGVSTNKHCTKCNGYFGMIVGDHGKCPTFGTPW